MARLPRLTLPGYPHHIIQRGNNRQAIFESNGDRQFLLNLLAENADKFGVSIHAYVLMDNHFHLLATPQTADGLPHMMQAVGRRYVRLFNDARGRSGTLWEGRYKSTLIQTDRYLLACMVYMDLNPVRAGLAASAADYVWSSYGHYAGTRVDPLITSHPLVWQLGNTPFAREAAYVALVDKGISDQEKAELTQSVLRGWALGDVSFVADLQEKTQRPVSKRAAGRPVLVKNSQANPASKAENKLK
jgi:putative transposase